MSAAGKFLWVALVCGTVTPSLSAQEETVSAEELAAVKAAEAARIEAIDKIYGAVVCIYGNDRAGGGSGVLFDEAGYALTNFHVVSAAGEEGWAGLADGKLYRWKLLGFDPGGDLAIIRLAGQDKFPAAPLGDSRQVRVGDWAMAVGNPFTLAEDQKPTVTLGVVSGVERFQPGAGKNSLVYGNCIQVDSSINPGNSGGPLFNLAGEIIGINGRASFEERGRVNVGVGYAISAEQAKNFLPDLLATKVCMHGTLDAVFEDRDGETVCARLNLDSTAARLGLELGDRLLSFAGQPITSQNQFTNLISTLPAEWPVDMVVEREGVRRRIRLRLDGLPYERRQQQARAQPQEGEPEDGAPEDGGEPEAPAPADPKTPEPAPLEIKVAAPEVEGGKIRNADMNRAEAERLLRRWAELAAVPPADAFFRSQGGTLEASVIDHRVGADSIERRQYAWAADGRFRELRLEPEGSAAAGAAYGFDGSAFWRQDLDGTVTPKEGADFGLEKMSHAPVAALAAVCRPNPGEAFIALALEGSDRVAGRRAYRLRGQLKSGQVLYLWFSVFDAEDRSLAPTLLKVAADADGERPTSGWLVAAPPAGAAAFFSLTSWTLVEGLSERPVMTLNITSHQLLDQAPDDDLKRPAGPG